MNVEVLGNIEPVNKHQSGNTYGVGGCSPTLMSGTHGYGFGYFLTVERISDMEQLICAMRGRDKDNPSLRTRSTENFEQVLKVNNHGTSNTITSVQKDNLCLDIRQATKQGTIPCKIGGVADLNYPTSKTRRGRVQEMGEVSPTLTTENIPSRIELGDPDFYNFIYDIDGEEYLIRIRKLIPLETWRLMDFSDEDFRKAEKVNSSTQLYKQAGNSIVKNCLVAIFGQMFEGKENVYKEIMGGGAERTEKQNVR